LHATFYRMLGRCLEMLRSSIACFRRLHLFIGRHGGFVLLWIVSS
jgi:hypothetical protein